MTLEALRETYRRELFDVYLPFWEKGGYDRKLGGFMCELNDDGTVFSDLKVHLVSGPRNLGLLVPRTTTSARMSVGSTSPPKPATSWSGTCTPAKADGSKK